MMVKSYTVFNYKIIFVIRLKGRASLIIKIISIEVKTNFKSNDFLRVHCVNLSQCNLP